MWNWNDKYVHTLRSSFENHTRFQTKMGKIYTRFQTKTAQKPPAKTLPDRAAHTYMTCITEYPPGPQLFSPWGPSRKKNDGYARRLSSGSIRSIRPLKETNILQHTVWRHLFCFVLRISLRPKPKRSVSSWIKIFILKFATLPKRI